MSLVESLRRELAEEKHQRQQQTAGFQQHIENLTSRLDEEQAKLRSTCAERDTSRRQFQEERDAHKKVDTEGNKQARTLNTRLQKLEHSSDQAETRIKTLQTQLSKESKQHQQTVAGFEQHIETLKSQVDKADAQVKSVITERNSLEQELSDERKAHVKASAANKTQTQKLNTHIKKLERTSEQATAKTAELKTDLDSATSQSKQLSKGQTKTIEVLTSRISEAQEKLRESTETRETLQELLDRERTLNENTKNESRKEIDTLSREVSELEEQLSKSVAESTKKDMLASQATDPADEIGRLRDRLNTSENALKKTRSELSNLSHLRNEEHRHFSNLESELIARDEEVLHQKQAGIVADERSDETITALTKERQALSEKIGELETQLHAADENLSRHRKDYETLKVVSNRQERDLIEYTKHADEQRAGDEWYLKADDDSEYGPVQLSELQEWASQCRIGPDHRVSRDKSEWIKAREIDDLDMCWYVELVNGNSLRAPEFIRRPISYRGWLGHN
jgi:chromosome segregation ATPase